MMDLKCNYCGTDANIEHDCIDVLKRELAELRERTRWIPVSERLPENGQRVYAQEYNGNITMFLYQSNLRLIFMRHYTHWQLLPLPEPPEDA